MPDKQIRDLASNQASKRAPDKQKKNIAFPGIQAIGLAAHGAT